MKHALFKTCIALALAVVVLGAAGASAFFVDDAGWINLCSYSHSAKDDPIGLPGQAGASHLHDFFGNTTTGANSTVASMRAGGTTCPLKKDTAGYWVPALYKNGTRVLPTGSGARTTIYYRNNLTGVDPATLHTIPVGLKMVAGNSHATSVGQNPELGSELYWGCSNNSPDVKATAPIQCSTGIESLHVGFPNCWDGVHLDSADHQSHMAYPVSSSRGYVCPAGHPVPIPRVIMRFEYPVGTTLGQITLASGPTYTVHGDFWNTWRQRALNTLVDRCFRGNMDCGNDPSV